MISIDDGPPPDPSSSHHHHLNINTDDDYKPSASVSNSDLKFPDADLDDTNTNNPLPNFSIRDHVFGLRSKDVACNWPFSSKSLQLCLRNGVKNLLPPFQPLDLLRNNNASITKCNLETRLARNEELVTHFNGIPTENQFKSVISDAAKPNQELPVRSISVNSSGSKENKESNARSKEKPLKKSRLVMKLNSGVDPVDQLDLAPNSFIVSETMASKICPVCKIFSSSSNTTLNAHIDQCLTGEASMKWTDNSKVNIVKHRVKPRKTRLMSDIYETAPHCTIEELDRRNGTSWATNSSFPAQEFEFQEEKEEPRLTATINTEVADNEGDVYIDTDGTKVRILSVPKAGSSDNNGARKLLKGVKGCKIVIGKKKRNLFKAKHHQKFLKLGSNTGKLRSPKPSNPCCASEIVDEHMRSGQEEGVAMAESCGKEEGGRELMKARVQIEVAGLAIVRPPWACSKRTRLSGKRRQLGLQNDPRKGFLVESDKSSPSSPIRKKTRTLSPLTNPNSNLLRKDDTFTLNDSEGSQDSYPFQHSEAPDIRPIKDTKFSSFKENPSFSAPKISSERKLSAFQKSYLRRLLKEKSVEGQSRNPNKQSRMEKDDTFTLNDSEGSQDSYPIQHSGGPDIRPIKSTTFSSFKKNPSFSAPKISSQRKLSTFQKSYLRCVLKEKSVEGQSRNPNKQSRMEKDDTFTLNDSEGSQDSYPIQHSGGPDIRPIKNTKSSSFKKNPSFSAPKISSQRKLSAFQKSYLRCLLKEKSVEGQSRNSPNEQSRMEDDTFTLNDSEGSQDSYPIQHSDGPDIRLMNNKFSSFKKNPSFSAPKTSSKRKLSAFQKSYIRCLLNEKSVEGQSRNSPNEQSRMEEDTDSARKESSIGESSEDGGLMGLSNSFDPEFSKLVAEPNKPYEKDQICSTNRAPDGKNIFGNDIELDDTEDIEKHQDYFQEVDHIDPIPIPGPPGSFLPSPGGDMVSEEIQPIRVPPSENPHNHDTIDQDSMSNSPVSTVSNPSLARSDSRSSEKVSFRSSSVQDDQRVGFSGFLIEPAFKKSFPVDHIEKGPNLTNFKNDQPCCCSKKESALSYSAASSYQDSSFLRKQQPTESTRNPNGFINFRSESMFLLNNYPTSQPPDTTKISVQPTGTAVKLPIYSDCDSAASPSKPVLRLMGKNLTVVKTDEDVSSHQFRSPMSQLVRNDPKEDHNSFSHGYLSHFNGQPPINMRSFMAATAAAHGGSNLGPMVPPSRSQYSYNGVNSQLPRGRNMYNSASSSNPIKEIIVIDDSSPENEAADSMRNEFLRRNSSGQMNQFYSMYQSQGYDHHHHPYGGGGGGGGGGYQTFLGMQMGSSSPSNSTSHLRSSTSYHPPSYP